MTRRKSRSLCSAKKDGVLETYSTINTHFLIWELVSKKEKECNKLIFSTRLVKQSAYLTTIFMSI